MNSKEALKRLKQETAPATYMPDFDKDECIETIKQDLNRLEKENTKLEQALEKACERLDYTCPVEEELIEDLDCENCDSNCKECWVKFFLKQVIESVGGE